MSMFRIAGLLPAVVVAIAVEPAPMVYADHTTVDVSMIPAEVLSSVRGKPVALAHPPQSTALVVGLQEMAKADPRLAVRSATSPRKTWYAEGGVGTYPSGGYNKLSTRLDAFNGAVARDALAGAVKVMQVQADANDLPSGRRIESGYTQYSATMDIRFTSTALQGIFVEEILAYQRIGNLLIGPLSYPLELPNFSLDHVSVSARVPIGLATPDAGAVQGDGGGGRVASNEPWPRDPRVAFAAYRDNLEKLEKDNPGTSVVWSTIPLTTGDNLQRSWFNVQVRRYAVEHGKPLFDLAALQSHGADGKVAYDDQGEVLAKDWVEGTSPTAMNATGRSRVATAWWYMMARIQGWKAPEAKPVDAGAAATGLSGS
jgi:hypothetical protein